MIANPGSYKQFRDDRPWLSDVEARKAWEQVCLDYIKQQKNLKRSRV